MAKYVDKQKVLRTTIGYTQSSHLPSRGQIFAWQWRFKLTFCLSADSSHVVQKTCLFGSSWFRHTTTSVIHTQQEKSWFVRFYYLYGFTGVQAQNYVPKPPPASAYARSLECRDAWRWSPVAAALFTEGNNVCEHWPTVRGGSFTKKRDLAPFLRTRPTPRIV